MAKKETKLSIRAIDEVMKENEQNEILVDWHGRELRITKVIGLTDMVGMVDDVVRNCCVTEGSVDLELMDMIFRKNVLDRYSNASLPSDIEHMYRILYQCDLFDTIMENVDPAQIADIRSSIEWKLDALTNANTAAMQMKMVELMNSFALLQDRLSFMFEGVEGSDVSALIGAITNGKIDEEKLAEAYVRASSGNAEKDDG